MKFTQMNVKRVLSVIGVGVGVMLMAACTTGATPGASPTAASGNNVTPVGDFAPSSGGVNPVSQLPAGSGMMQQDSAALSRNAAAYGLSYASSSGNSSGIWVTGRGQVSAKPDLAVINVGVEAQAKTVDAARAQAAQAMDAIIKALRDAGVAEKDIQTQYFNIYPRYTSRKWTQCDPVPALPNGETKESPQSCYDQYEQIIIGYTVTNQLTVKIRNLDTVGSIIDQVTAAGGDLTRLNGISFTIEDENAIQTQAREAAVKDALAKAKQFAQLTDVTLGKLLYITETSYAAPLLTKAYERADVAGAPSVPTPIQAGELEVLVTVQAVFAIE